MLKDELMPLTAMEAPPEDLDLAMERIQWAGEHPTKLVGTVWKNVDQFLHCVKNLTDGKENWEANAAVIMDCGPRLKIYAGYASSPGNEFIFIMQAMPMRAKVIGAKTTAVKGEWQAWLANIKDVLGSGADIL